MPSRIRNERSIKGYNVYTFSSLAEAQKHEDADNPFCTSLKEARAEVEQHEFWIIYLATQESWEEWSPDEGWIEQWAVEDHKVEDCSPNLKPVFRV